MADGSGFRWGQDRLQPNFGFRWRERPFRALPARVHHPSGFSFAEAPADTMTTAQAAHAPAHPSGFRFREAPSPAMPAGDHPKGFSWDVNKAKQGTSFRWKT